MAARTKLRPRAWFEAGLLAAALCLGLLGLRQASNDWLGDTLFFGAWCAALLLLLSLALRLPLRAADTYGRRVLRFGLVALGCGVAVLANLALYRHDVHFDVTRTGEYTAPPELAEVVNSLRRDMSLTYFYNEADENARAVREAMAVLARGNRHLRYSTVDVDQHPEEARALGVRAYNTAVIEAQGRRVQVENTVDLHQVAFAILRAQNERQETACFITGHGEPYETLPPHVHYTHVETTQGENAFGAGEIVVGTDDGLDRLRLALAAFGYADKAITPATLAAIPDECAAVVEIGPRHDWAPGEAETLAAFLGRGGRLLVMADGIASVPHELQDLLGRAGLSIDEGIVLDPLNHYGADPEKIAVPYYPTHPITERIAMTVFPNARSLRVGKLPDGVRTVPLVVSSKDSYHRTTERPGDDESAPAPAVLAAALDGHWPGSSGEAPFRLVVVGNSAFAENAFFPVVSNGELAASMIRWLTGDTDTPTIQPQRFSLPAVLLTHRQMQAVFVLVEMLLPLAVMLIGAMVWWRRR
jgi:ABC-type uncharacterized transport system